MPNDQYQEVLIAIVTSVLVLGLLIGTMVFLMLNYQKKRFLHLEEKRRLEEEYQKNLLQSRLEIQEETFDNISREIHDNVGQLLSLVKVQLNIARQQPGDELLSEIKANVGQAMTDLRDIAKSLSTSRLQQVSIAEAVSQELQRIERGGVLKCSLETSGAVLKLPELSEQKKVILFRIVQESLQNIMKHAEAKRVVVQVVGQEEGVSITVTDDGTGFTFRAGESTGLGLENIRKRAVMAGGEAAITSAVGKGTQVSIYIPYA